MSRTLVTTSSIAALAAFAAGLLAVGWIGAGYVGGHPLALAMIVLIAAFYLLGGLELRRFHQATSGLKQALAALPDSLAQPDDWLATVPPALQNPVRLRIDGERAALPGPAMTPYLVGLLVLLGMLGTFLGMVVTLNGTVSALESTTDLAAIRASLAAPVKGLGLAFGTSVAGVAASAMLGLVSALCRRDRLQASQLLDTRIATVLRGFSQAHRRQESFRTLQAQAQLMPQLVDRLQALMAQMEQQGRALNDGLTARQQALSEGLAAGQKDLGQQLMASQQALSRDMLASQKALVDQLVSGQTALSERLVSSQQAHGERLQTHQQALSDGLMAGQQALSQDMLGSQKALVDQWVSSQQAHAERLQSSQQTLSDGLTASQQALSQEMLAGQKALAEQLVAGQQAHGERLQSSQQALSDGLTASQQALGEHLRSGQQALSEQLLSGQQGLSDKLQAGQHDFHRQAEAVYTGLAASVDQSLKHSLGESARLAGEAIQPAVEATMSGITREANALHARVGDAVQQQLEGLTQRFSAELGSVADQWQQALARHAETSAGLATETRAALNAFAQTFEQRSVAFADGFEQRSAAMAQTFEQRLTSFADTFGQRAESLADTLAQRSDAFAQSFEQQSAAFADGFEQRASSLLDAAHQAQSESRTVAAQQEQQRLAAWTQSLEVMASTLQREWQQAGEHSVAQQQKIFDALDQTARSIGTQAEAHARHTIEEITQLMHAAADAPRLAAEVIGHLRQQLSDSMARDNTLLDERQRMMASLNEVLEAVQQASTDQRQAVDTLVSSTAATLDRVSTQLTEAVSAEAGQLSAAAAQITGSAVEVASLGEAFGFAVQLFSESSDKLMAQLQQIEASLGKSTTRSDEQLAYYVAQAREIIDLSISSQKQIVDDLQQLAGKPPVAKPAAGKESAGNDPAAAPAAGEAAA